MSLADASNIRSIDVGGIRTRYFEKGTGDPLVFIHGGAIGTGSSFEIFSENLGPLSRSFRVIAMDKIGQGETENPESDADYTVDRMTRHVHDFIRALGLEKLWLVGQSRGAFNGIEICLEDPGRIRAFVLCNSASMVPGAEAIPAFSKKARAEVAHPAGSLEWVRHRSEMMCHDRTTLTDAYVKEWHRIHHLPKSALARGKMTTLGPGCLEPSVDRAKRRVFERLRAGALKVPVLVHWGRKDPSAPFETDGMSVYRLLAENADEVSLHVANHAGHFAFRERAREFNLLVPAFFAAHA